MGKLLLVTLCVFTLAPGADALRAQSGRNRSVLTAERQGDSADSGKPSATEERGVEAPTAGDAPTSERNFPNGEPARLV